MHLTLLVPELIWPEPGDTLTLGKLDLPGIEWLLGRMALTPAPRQPYEALLGALGGRQASPLTNLASLRWQGEAALDQGPGEQRADQAKIAPSTSPTPLLCADPVHLRFHHERIVLADAGAFELELAEAEALAAALNAQFADIGRLEVVTPRRWYLHLATAVDHPAPPLSAVTGRRMDSELADKTTALYRWLNEVQMVLHQHPVNAARSQRGQPAVNSLWLWGGSNAASPSLGAASSGAVSQGAVPAGSASPDSHTQSPDLVVSDDPLAIGLARQVGAASQSATRLDELVTGRWQRPLVHLDQLLPPVSYEDPHAWREAWRALDADWFQPLRGQLGKSVKKLDLIAPTIYGCLRGRVTAHARWQFWKPARPLAELAKTLAESSPAP